MVYFVLGNGLWLENLGWARLAVILLTIILILKISHEQGFFEDGLGDNVGFFDDNTVRSEDPTGRGYRYGNKHYDDDLMREALKNVYKGDYSLLGWGKKKKNNCQDWAERLREEYRRLEKERSEKDSKCKK